jgi:hypothetical protein
MKLDLIFENFIMKARFKHRVQISHYYLSDVSYISPEEHDRIHKDTKPTKYIKKALKDKFPSIKFLPGIDKQLRFNFSTLEDEAFFLVWSSTGIEL